MTLFRSAGKLRQRFKFNSHLLIQLNLFFLINSLSAQNQINLELNSNWEFRKVGDSSNWMPAIVPGCVQTDLLENEIIPDPFFGDNEKEVQWIEREDWEYRCSFKINHSVLKKDFIELHFDGLDTYAAIYLNDQYLGTTENMFVQYQFSVKGKLRSGTNQLYIRFFSAVVQSNKLDANSEISYPPDARVWARKAQYQFGWDWGPRLVTTGIWKPVKIAAWNDGRIHSFSITTVYANPDSAKFYASYDYELAKQEKIKLKLTNRSTNQIIQTKYVSDPKFSGRIYDTIQNPALWWCNGMGEPNLYTFELKISKGLRQIDKKTITTGLRTIELIDNTDKKQGEFYFKLNGQPVFAKGANMIPMHSFPAEVTYNDYKKLLSEAKAMHMNMIRIWGGGIYESDDFYSICDSLGILVWQDFMFAGGMYPLNELNYKNNISNEIAQQINRLKIHPCIALWCGNNEVLEGWQNWGWQNDSSLSEDHKYKIYTNYSDWFDVNIPTELKLNLERSINYHPSSPSIGWGHPESLLQGDCHYWGVWWGGESFDTFDKKIPRFMSEYGFQGMPSYRSFQKFIHENDLTGNAENMLSNPRIKNHQKHPVGRETIQNYMQRDYIVPENFENYIYVSQLLQAKGMETAIEAHRRNMPYCMGTLFWQLNDCWPVTSWSVIDFYGERKASYYTVKEKYKPVILSALIENDSLKVYLVNDEGVKLNGTLILKFAKTSGEILSYTVAQINQEAKTSSVAYSEPIKNITGGFDTTNLFLYASLMQADSILAEDFCFFTEIKNLQLAIPKADIIVSEKNGQIILRSENLVKNIYLYTDAAELKLSENYFDLFPGVQKVIRIEGKCPPGLSSEIKYKSLNTIYRN